MGAERATAPADGPGEVLPARAAAVRAPANGAGGSGDLELVGAPPEAAALGAAPGGRAELTPYTGVRGPLRSGPASAARVLAARGWDDAPGAPPEPPAAPPPDVPEPHAAAAVPAAAPPPAAPEPHAAAAGPAAAPASAVPEPPRAAPEPDVEALAAEVYERVERRLRRELLIAGERAGRSW
jgi:hypothetical protein